MLAVFYSCFIFSFAVFDRLNCLKHIWMFDRWPWLRSFQRIWRAGRRAKPSSSYSLVRLRSSFGGMRPRQSGESHTIPLTDGFGCGSGKSKNIGSAILLSRLIQQPATEQVYYRKVEKILTYLCLPDPSHRCRPSHPEFCVWAAWPAHSSLSVPSRTWWKLLLILEWSYFLALFWTSFLPIWQDPEYTKIGSTWVSEQRVFNELGFIFVIMPSFELV